MHRAAGRRSCSPRPTPFSGQGQLSLAKYLLIVAREDDPELDIHDIPAFLQHLLRRVDWRTDLHFQTGTTIDTLDYSGSGLNEGSKLVIAAVGPPRRELPIAVARPTCVCRMDSATRAWSCRASWRFGCEAGQNARPAAIP